MNTGSAGPLSAGSVEGGGNVHAAKNSTLEMRHANLGIVRDTKGHSNLRRLSESCANSLPRSGAKSDSPMSRTSSVKSIFLKRAASVLGPKKMSAAHLQGDCICADVGV